MAALIALIISPFLFFIVIILSVFLGAAAAWCIDCVFHETIFNTLHAFGINTGNLQLWQIGATLAFVGAYFKQTQVRDSK